MKTTIALLAATAALGAIIAIPAVGSIRSDELGESGSPRAAISAFADITQDGMVLLASGDDEDDDEGRDCEDDEGDDNEGDEDERDDNKGDCAAGSNPAPAGTVAPPANGLFGKGAAPRVQVN